MPFTFIFKLFYKLVHLDPLVMTFLYLAEHVEEMLNRYDVKWVTSLPIEFIIGVFYLTILNIHILKRQEMLNLDVILLQSLTILSWYAAHFVARICYIWWGCAEFRRCLALHGGESHCMLILLSPLENENIKLNYFYKID